jgi:dolichol-phosphate mannosyltransferase
MGRVACRTNAEQVVHASMLTTFVYRFGPIDGRPARRTSRVLAHGQCLVGRRADLLAAGIDSIGMRAGEDVALARLVTARGGTVARLDAASHLRVRGYAGGRWTWAGWGRSFALGDLTTPGWLAADLLVVWFAQVLPLLRLLVRRGDPLDVVALALRVGTLVGTRRAYDEPGLAYWLSPLADGPVAYLFTKTAWRPPRTWRDRTYADRPPRLNRRRGNG